MEREIITSRQNPLVKLVCGLAEKKIRSREGLFRFDGIKLLCEALDSDIDIRYIVYREGSAEAVMSLIDRARREGRLPSDGAVCVSVSVFEKISEEKAPEGVITVAHMPAIHKKYEGEQIDSGEILLLAESLRDPGNLGTVIRSCYALGIDRLIITDDCTDLFAPKTLRAAMGAIFKLPTLSVGVEEMSEFIGRLCASGRRVYATALTENAEKIGDVELSRGDCFVIGNEGHGLREQTIRVCSQTVIIPMREDAESLNAAAAAAICIWETVKRNK